MHCLIYQYRIGHLPAYAQVSRQSFETYAKTIGADYRFDHNPRFFRGKYASYHTALRPIFDRAFHIYDRVLFTDMDVVPTAGLTENIFDQPIGHFAMVEEREQPARREAMDPKQGGQISAAHDQTWAETVRRAYGIDVPRDALGRPRVFNSGVVLYSGEGLRTLHRYVPRPGFYRFRMQLARLPRFYKLDQNFLGAFTNHPKLTFTPLPQRWNAQVISLHNADKTATLLDERTPESCLIHVQHTGRNAMSADDMRAVQAGTYDFGQR